jgi:hypothetical protein
MSLLVIPAAFTVLDDLGGWFARKFHRQENEVRGG